MREYHVHHKIIRVSKRWWENRLKRPLDTGTGTPLIGIFWLVGMWCHRHRELSTEALNGLWKSTPRMNWIPQKYRQGSWLSNIQQPTVASPRQVVSIEFISAFVYWVLLRSFRQNTINPIHVRCSPHSIEPLSSIRLSLQCNISWKGWIKSQLRLIFRSRTWWVPGQSIQDTPYFISWLCLVALTRHAQQGYIHSNTRAGSLFKDSVSELPRLSYYICNAFNCQNLY